MPIDWENNIITKNPHTKTRFCSVPVDEASSCHKVGQSLNGLYSFSYYSSSVNILKTKKQFLLLSHKEAHVLHISSCKLFGFLN